MKPKPGDCLGYTVDGIGFCGNNGTSKKDSHELGGSKSFHLNGPGHGKHEGSAHGACLGIYCDLEDKCFAYFNMSQDPEAHPAGEGAHVMEPSGLLCSFVAFFRMDYPHGVRPCYTSWSSSSRVRFNPRAVSPIPLDEGIHGMHRGRLYDDLMGTAKPHSFLE